MIPTTKQLVDQAISYFESRIAQTVPANDKAFFRVLSVVLGILITGLYKLGVDRAKQCLAKTATGASLDEIGDEYGVTRKAATATVLTATIPGTNGTLIPATVDFVADSTGLRYSLDSSVTVAGGVGTLTLTAQQTGTVGNLSNGETLTIGTPVAGVESIATVTGTTTTGTEEETDDDYRVRILDVKRSPGGGGNAADYRNWSQEVAGVKRAYPYAGKPIALLATSTPPDRTVYIESSVDTDGIPTTTLLDQVRDSITTDPVTGESRQPLGLTDETLYVEPITRTEFFVQISSLTVDSTIEASVKADIETALQNYFLRIQPFADGLDAPAERNDLITDLTVSNVVQDVLAANGGSAQAVAFDTISGSSIPEYQLTQGELAKLADSGGVTYV